jgi:tripartite-type tricarboxylate transporter receptor subunit TctC
VSQISISPFTHSIKFDPVRDFKPISIIAVSPFVIVVPKDLPVATLKEFVDYAKARPDQLNFGSAGVGALSHFASELFVRRAELKMTHVPYRGGALALSDLLGGNIQMLSASPIEIQQYVGTGQIKLLGISSLERSPQLPDVPAIAEIYPGHSAITWNGLLAPAGTPQEIIDKVSAEMQSAQQDPAFRERLEKLGVTPIRHTPADFAKIIADDMAHWRVVVEQIGLKAQ